MSDFIELYRIEVMHDYYRDACCGDIIVVPTKECLRYIHNLELFIRQDYKNRWLICARNSDIDIERIKTVIAGNDTKLEFYLEYNNPEFFLYTDWPNYKPHLQYLFSTDDVDTIKDDRTIKFGVTESSDVVVCRVDNEQYKVNNGSIAILSLNLSADIFDTEKIAENNVVNVKILFNCNRSHWEYILIPRTFNDKQRVFLEEESGKLKFDTPDEHDMPDGQKSYVTMVKDIVDLKENYNYRINLLEEKNGSKRVLQSAIDYPSVTDFSDSNVDDNIRVVTKYIYF
jgi:hypothetical protein